MKPYLQHLGYVLRHKWFVLVAGRRLSVPLWRLLVHDWTKLGCAEWGPYARHWFGERTEETQAAFDRAWLHHQKANRHHWHYWLLRSGHGKERALRMPEVLAREMVADWMGAERAISGFWDIGSWYDREKEGQTLHPETRTLVDALIESVRCESSACSPEPASCSSP